jgi:predicted  nucleic acid-binding Zn-ribbon protein
MFEDLKWLVELQKLDNQIYQLTGEERNTNSFISKMKQEIEELSLNKVKHIRKLREHQEDLESYEEDITDHKRILSQKQIDLENDKKTKKEHIRREVKKLEKAVDVFQERVDEINADVIAINEEVTHIDKEISKLKRKIRAEEKKKNELVKISKTEFDKLEKKKIKIQKLIRTPFLNHYNRIMKIRNSVAITYVTEEGLCNGCRIHTPYQLQQKIKLGNDYTICEGCGRILVDAQMLKDKKKK